MATDLWQRLAARRRRKVIDAFFANVELRRVEWMPPQDSPLRCGSASVMLPVDAIIGPRTLAHGHWHREHTDLLLQRLRAGGKGPHLLVDVGANIGLVTRQLLAGSPEAWTGAVCFEPERANLEMLRWNTQPLPRVAVVAGAISDHDGQATLHVDHGNVGDCSLDELPFNPERAATSQQQVQLLSGANAYAQISAQRLGDERIAWKSDTQGHDLKVVAAMPEALWQLTDVAMVEVQTRHATDDDIAAFLQRMGGFANLASVKHGARQISLGELEAFCRRRSGSEFDLLACR